MAAAPYAIDYTGSSLNPATAANGNLAVKNGTTYNAPVSTNSVSSASQTPSNNYSVVSSAPAQQNIQDLTAAHQNITQGVKNQAQNVTANTAVANSLPVIPGYNVSATKTGNLGEQEAKNNTTGQSYFITPQKTAPTANDIVTALTGGTSSGSATATTTGSTSTSTTSGSITSGSTNGLTTEDSAYQSAIGQAQSDISSAYQAFKVQMQQLQNGTFPLSQAQSTLLQSTSDAFDAMMNSSELKAAALSSETGGMSSKINATMGEQANIQASKASALANMELGFQQQNYKLANDAYTAFNDAEQKMTDLLTKQHQDVVDQYNTAISQNLAQKQFDETTIKDNAQLEQNKYEFRDLKDAIGTTIGTQIFDKATGKAVSSSVNAGQTDPATGQTSPTTVTNPDGTVDKASQYATLQKVVPQPYQALVWQIVNGNGESPNTKNVAGQKLASWVAQVDPTLADGSGGFDSTKYAARLTMQKGLASSGPSSLGGAMKVANTVVAHLKSFLDTSSKLTKNSNFSPINSLETEVAGDVMAVFGNDSMQSNSAQATTISKGLTDEMTKFFKGTGSTDVASIASWGNGLNPNAAMGTLKGNIQGGLTLFSGQFNTFLQQYKDTMGKDADISRILQPETVGTLSAFKNEGYKIDVPGIYYTDKSAWQSNGGNQDQWNSAVDALTQQGIPLTQENILQAAQVLNE